MRRLALFALLFLNGTYGTDPNGKAPVRSLIQSLRARAESMQHEGALHVTPLASVRNPKRGDASAHWSRFAGARLELERDAGSTAARLRAVDALVSYMRVLSDGNALTIGKGGKIELSDTAANRKLWATHAQAALGLLGPLLVDGAAEKDPMLAAMHAEALTYKESARGVIKSATSGGAISFLSSTNLLYDRHRRYDSAVSCIFSGAFYLAAPWPLGSVKKGRRFFDEARTISCFSLMVLHDIGHHDAIARAHSQQTPLFCVSSFRGAPRLSRLAPQPLLRRCRRVGRR